MDSNPPSSRPASESPTMSHSQLGGQLSSKSLKMGLPMLDTSSKLAKGFSRVDYESVYNQLSEGMDASEWSLYKDAVGRFLTGKITRPELLTLIQPLLDKTPSQRTHKIRLHNQFLLLLPLNAHRPDPPQTPAHFVSSSTLPTHSYRSTPAQTELRLKTEVMALPYRDRKRIKQLPLSPPPSPPPEMIDFGHAPTGAAAGTQRPDWGVFASQAMEFPDHEAMRARMAPIAYSCGLKPAISPDLVAFVTLASETFVKEILGSVLSRTSKHRRPRDEDGAYIPQVAGKGPARRPKRRYDEIEEKLITMDDIRLSCSLGENLVHLLPGALGRIMVGAGGRGEREYWREVEGKGGRRGWMRREEERVEHRFGKPEESTDKEGEEEDLGWVGSSGKDREELKGLLDGILTFP
ncbi:hypothetical protein BJ508DRAFT_76997 [Ascobolus immersus RN42]|uniref:Uncharacterized protein n=1 Tax=Ascobolus immersus RN42 TaxID=1160509 RepID=A0A3N4HJ56_ASCIM|nr:hypothetical protein BJ508DRAFT_76997 [Ascobolus immersus RN42]